MHKIPLWIIAPMTFLSYIGIILTDEKYSRWEGASAFLNGALLLFFALSNYDYRVKLKTVTNIIRLTTDEQINEFVSKLGDRYKSMLKSGAVNITESIV